MRLSSTPIANAGLTFQITVPPNTLSLSRDRNFIEPSTYFHDDTTKPDVNTSSMLAAFMEVHQLAKPNNNKEIPLSLTVYLMPKLCVSFWHQLKLQRTYG